MANEKDSITRKAKIEIDVQQSEKKLKELNSQLKEVQKRLNEISRLKDRAFSTYSLSQQYRLSSSLGVSRSGLSSMGSRDLTRLQANETQKLERIQSRLQSQELTHKKRILDLERSTQKVEEDRERTRKKRLSSLEKEARQTERIREDGHPGFPEGRPDPAVCPGR